MTCRPYFDHSRDYTLRDSTIILSVLTMHISISVLLHPLAQLLQGDMSSLISQDEQVVNLFFGTVAY